MKLFEQILVDQLLSRRYPEFVERAEALVRLHGAQNWPFGGTVYTFSKPFKEDLMEIVLLSEPWPKEYFRNE